MDMHDDQVYDVHTGDFDNRCSTKSHHYSPWIPVNNRSTNLEIIASGGNCKTGAAKIEIHMNNPATRNYSDLAEDKSFAM